MDNYHITKNDKVWALTKQGAERASKTSATKAEITQLASEFLADKTASLKIHKEDGTIQEERTFPRSADPTKSEG
jgi:hypothetical protein